MGLHPGDAIVVYSSAPTQCLTLWFQIKTVEVLSVTQMCNRYHGELGINHEDYLTYFMGLDFAVGLHIGEVHPVTPIPLHRIEDLVPGFVPPQGILWLRDDVGRFEKLLAQFSIPLPASSFPQQSLIFDG
jgi:predicted transcriptional regulator